MECSEKLSFDAEKITGQEPELRHKNHFVVTNDRVEEIIILHYQLDNHFCRF